MNDSNVSGSIICFSKLRGLSVGLGIKNVVVKKLQAQIDYHLFLQLYWPIKEGCLRKKYIDDEMQLRVSIFLLIYCICIVFDKSGMDKYFFSLAHLIWIGLKYFFIK
jgi:hypothetical protein